MTDHAGLIGADPWRGGAAVRADVDTPGAVDLPADAVELLASVGLPEKIEGMFYLAGAPLLEPRTVDGADYYHLGLNEEEFAGAYLARRGDGQVWHVSPDGTETLFVNSTLPLFQVFLKRWLDFLEEFRDVDDDDLAIRHGKKLKKELKKLDPRAFRGDQAWWDFVFEEVAEGILLPGD